MTDFCVDMRGSFIHTGTVRGRGRGEDGAAPKGRPFSSTAGHSALRAADGGGCGTCASPERGVRWVLENSSLVSWRISCIADGDDARRRLEGQRSRRR